MCRDVVSLWARRVVFAAIFISGFSIHAASVTLAWDASTSPNIAGYTLRYGTVRGIYPNAIPVGNLLSATAPNLTAGITYYFVVTARNTSGLESAPSNEVAYTPPGTPTPSGSPTLDPLNNLTISEDAGQQTVLLSGITVGLGNILQLLLGVSASSSNPNLIPNPTVTYTSPNSTGTLRFTPVPNASGIATITVTINNFQLLNNLLSRTFNVTVNPVNDPPTLTAIANQTVSQNSTTAALGITLSDPDTSTSSLTLAGISSNTTLVPNGNITFGGSGANRTVTIRPASNQTGTATITVTVSDGVLTANRSFSITVNSTSTVPPLYLEAEAGSLVTPMVAGTDPRAAGGRYVYSSTANQGTVSFPVNLTQAGDYVVWCRTLAANIGANSFFVSVDGGLEDIYDSTPAGVTNTWLWTQVNGRAGGAARTLNPRLFTLSAGSHTIRLRAREALASFDALYITTDRNFVPPSTPANPANQPPTLNPIANVTLNEDAGQQSVSLTGITSGAAGENQALSVTTVSSNPGLIPNPIVTYTSPGSAGTLRFTPVANTFGTATITVTVNDGQTQNNTATRSFVINVNPINDEPTLNPINNLRLAANAESQTIIVSGISSGAANEAQILTASAISSNPSLISNPTVTYASPSSTGTLRFTPVANAFGTSTITVTVNDGQAQNNVISRIFTVTVSAPASHTATFSNPSPIIMTDEHVALPYSTSINVPGLPGTITHLSLHLNNLNHEWPDDLDILLVGPTGQKVIALSDVGGGNRILNLSLTLSDAVPSSLPDAGALTAGTFKPADFEIGRNFDWFPPPAPAGPYANTLSSFYGLPAEGTWSLYIVDDSARDFGILYGGWGLTITTTVDLLPASNQPEPNLAVTLEPANLFGTGPLLNGTGALVTGLEIISADTGAITLGWHTDRPAWCAVNYGEGESPEYYAILEPTASTEHVVTLTDLGPATTYWIRIYSVDELGNISWTKPATATTRDPEAILYENSEIEQ